MPIMSCFNKIRNGFILLVPDHPGCLGRRNVVTVVQDDVCVGGLVVVLSNDDVSVVKTALEVSLNFIQFLIK